MNILGISFLSDASAAIVKDGKLVSAVSEERLNRVKLWNGIPRKAIAAALDLAGLTLDEIDLIATHGAAPRAPDPSPFLEKERAIKAASLPPEARDRQLERLQQRLEKERMVLGERTPGYLEEIRKYGKPVWVGGHHEAHAASAFYGSGWKDCLVLTADGWGEDGSSTIWQGGRTGISRLAFSYTFDSLGYYYGSITRALGFIPHRHEGKVQGLAAYCSSPRSYAAIHSLIDYDSKQKRFIGRMEHGLYVPSFDNPALAEFIQQYPREDIAAATQKRLEEVVCQCVADFDGRCTRIALAGGIFANVKLNQRIHEFKSGREIFIFPDMGDGGLSVGAAWLVYARETGKFPEPLEGVYLGPESSEKEIHQALSETGLPFEYCSNIEEQVAQLLAEGHVVACHQGRMEYGPRALGNRSILYQATDPSVNCWLNQRLGRSEFMPFAPVTLEEYANEYYMGLEGARQAARYMTITFSCTSKMKTESPAAVHVDDTARPQVVSAKENPWLHRVLAAYHKRTGLASVVNTSFNMHEEPIVCTAEDTLRAFRAARIPFLAIGNFLVKARKEDPID